MRIRISAVNFVKSSLVALPAVPSEEEYEALKEQRKLNTVKQIEEERDASRRAKEKFENQQKREGIRDMLSPTKAEQAALGIASSIRGG